MLQLSKYLYIFYKLLEVSFHRNTLFHMILVGVFHAIYVAREGKLSVGCVLNYDLRKIKIVVP